jgi:hypothetical protein
MSVGNLKTQGDKGNNWTWQNSVLQLLGTIVSNTGGTAGQDYELVTTYYRANKNGVGYSLGDSITRTQIVLVPSGVITATIWFNQTTGLAIAAPPIADIDVAAPATSVVVSNLPLTLGQKNMAGSAAVVIASDQSSIPVTLPAGVSLTPSLVNVPANTALTNTVAGKKQVSLRVASGANATIDGVAVPNGTTVTFTATGNDTVGAISYSTGVGTRIIISYLT